MMEQENTNRQPLSISKNKLFKVKRRLFKIAGKKKNPALIDISSGVNTSFKGSLVNVRFYQQELDGFIVWIERLFTYWIWMVFKRTGLVFFRKLDLR